jgi:hypothetical protein
LEAAGDQTVSLATIRADSGASSGAAVLHALAQLCETMVTLVGEGEMGYARAVHEAIGRLLTPSIDSTEACQAHVIPLKSAKRPGKEG